MTPSKKLEARKLKGFLDYSPKQMELKNRIILTLKQVSELYGFEEISTPSLEYSEVLLGEGAETDKQVFRFMDNGERDVGLRYDLTMPFARFVAENHGALALPFRRMQVGQVWRAEKPQKGRYREFTQADLDIIGTTSRASDAEILRVIAHVLKELKIPNFKIRVGNRKILTEMMNHILKADPHQHKEVLILCDKLEKIGPDAVKQGIKNLGLDGEEFIDLLLKCKKDIGPLFDKISNHEVLKEHEKLMLEIADEKVETDLSIARGLAYYTGIVFETTLVGHENLGSICSGGRYDELVERFLHDAISGVGGSLGVDRLISILEGLSLNPYEEKAQAQVYVAIATEDAYDYGIKILSLLRNSPKSISAIHCLDSKKLKNQFKQADRAHVKFVITVGSDELTSQTVQIKNMLKREEHKNIPFERILDYLI